MKPSDRPAIGIIGVGAMGMAVTERLIDAGYIVCGSPRSRRAAFTAAGGLALAGNCDVVRRVDTLLLLLADDAALADVLAEIGSALKPDHLIVSLGSHSVSAKVRAAENAGAAHATFLDGEISGTPAMLQSGTGTVMVAGDEAQCGVVADVLGGFASKVSYVGAFGNAARMKLVTNYLVGVHTLAAAEALLLAGRLGLDPNVVVDAISPSAGGSAMLAVRGRMMATKQFGNGTMRTFVKVFERLREELGGAEGEANSMLEFSAALYARAIEAGHGDRDIAAVYEYLGDETTHAGAADF